jgi:hypothetical protein
MDRKSSKSNVDEELVAMMMKMSGGQPGALDQTNGPDKWRRRGEVRRLTDADFEGKRTRKRTSKRTGKRMGGGDQ